MNKRKKQQNIKLERKETKRLIKINIKHRKQKYILSLPSIYQDERRMEFTQEDVEDYQDELQNKPEKKFSVSIPPEYVEIINDIVRRDSNRWKHIKITKNSVIKEAIGRYIRDRGYIVTKETLFFQEVTELEPLIALCKNAKKLRDFPAWIRGHWIRQNPFTGPNSWAEYVSNASDEDVDRWFHETFEKKDKGKILDE